MCSIHGSHNNDRTLKIQNDGIGAKVIMKVSINQEIGNSQQLSYFLKIIFLRQ